MSFDPAAPTLQQVWDWRAAGNFIGGGTGTGLLMATAVAALAGLEGRLFILAALLFVGVGLSLVWLEIGRPLRAVNVFFHPKTSWMTREAMIALPLMLFGLAALWLQWPLLLWLAALLGAVFLYCQARILQASRGIPVWRTRRIVPLIVTSGLAEGVGLLALLIVVAGASVAPHIHDGALVALLLAVAARYLAWRHYRRGLEGEAPRAALEVLGRAETGVMLMGTLLPALLAVGGLIADEMTAPLAGGAGLLAAFGGWFAKFVIVTRASYNQGFALVHTPARGGGKPGPGTKPGW